MPETAAGRPDPLRPRAMHALLRRRVPGQTPFRRITPAMADDLLGWAATLPDETLLDMRDIGPTMLRWIRDHQPDESQAVRSDSRSGSMLATVLQSTGWRVEVFWNRSAGWFTARLTSQFDRDGKAFYPGGYLVPFENPLGASGATPEEAVANLSEAVLEWA